MANNTDDLIVELYKSSFDRMHAVAYRELGDSAMAEDIVHETFLVLLTRKQDLVTHVNPGGWLMTVMMNLIRNSKRKMDNLVLQLDEACLQYGEAAPEPLEHLLPSGLSADDRQIIIWRYEQQLGSREISDRLGISESGCRSRLHRAVQRCSELLDGRK